MQGALRTLPNLTAGEDARRIRMPAVAPAPDDFSTLVCPLDLRPFTRSDILRCLSGHPFSLVEGIPDLAVVEDRVAALHHRPDRKVGSLPSYHQRRLAAPRSIATSKLLGRIRALRNLSRSVGFYRRSVPRAFAELRTEAPDLPPPPPTDGFVEIYGPGYHAHELLKRLEKELFWDRLSLPRPAYEIGTSNGYASRYFFAHRELDYGSEYLIDDLVGSHTPHALRFSANIKFLPFPDQTLETVLCSQTITCVHASILSILAEINRVLRPGGRFLFTTHGPAYLNCLPFDGWREMHLSSVDCQRRIEERSSYMAHLYTLEEWRQILEAAGFELAESRGILSLDLARYSQLFYFPENIGPNIFRERYLRGLRGKVVQLLFGGSGAYHRCQGQYREMMHRILSHELSRNANVEFEDRRHLDAGIVAVKRTSVSIPRLTPHLAIAR